MKRVSGMGCVKQVEWDDLNAYEISAQNYTALIVPKLGANVIKLTWQGENGEVCDILRTPKDEKTLINDPYAYGVPVLLPANRVKDGFYEYDGVKYEFVQNYPNKVHIHGVLHTYNWRVDSTISGEEYAVIVLKADTSDETLRKSLPIDLCFTLECRVDKDGLRQRFSIQNKSEKTFPFGLAYHTALNVNFCNSKNDSAVKLHVPISARCVDDPIDRLPSGEVQELDEIEKRIASNSGANPLETCIDALYTGTQGKQVAIIRDEKAGYEMQYSASEVFKYWIIWNKTTTEGFVAVEPQTWCSNAMALENPREHGAFYLKPNDCFSADTQFAIKKINCN